jgi:hypothetical protein
MLGYPPGAYDTGAIAHPFPAPWGTVRLIYQGTGSPDIVQMDYGIFQAGLLFPTFGNAGCEPKE